MSRLAALVVGAGALGNEVIKNLVLLGVGRLAVIDRDCVEASNLTRSVLYCMGGHSRFLAQATPKAPLAAARARELNPDVQTGWMTADIGEVGACLLRGFDVVFSCLDNAAARMVLSRLCLLADRLLVDGGLGLVNSSDGLISIFPGRNGPCYACRKGPQRRAELIAELYARTVPCWGRDAETGDGSIPTTPLLASAVGAFQVELGLRAALDGQAPEAGDSIRLRMHPRPAISRFAFERSPDCPLHFDAQIETIALDRRSDQTSMLGLLETVGEPDGYLALDGAIVHRAACPLCGFEWPPMKRRNQLRSLHCLTCGSLGVKELDALTEIRPDSEWAQKNLTDLGLPAGHLHEVISAAGGKRMLLELAGDADLPGGGLRWD